MRKLFSIYDSKAKCYWHPFTSETRGTGLRQWEAMVNDERMEMLYKYPSDHTLYEIGEFDSERGVVSAYAENVNLGLADGVKRVPEGMLPLESAVKAVKSN